MILNQKVSIPEDRVMKAVTKLPQSLDNIFIKVYGTFKYPSKPERDAIEYFLSVTPSVTKQDNKYSLI